MPSCVALQLECVVGAAAGVVIIACYWRLRRPLRWAQTYDAGITEEGLFDELPIYGYLRRYLLLVLFAGLLVLLTSLARLIGLLVESIPADSCPELDSVGPVAGLLLFLLGIHLSTIAWFESVKRRHGPYRIKALVDAVGKLLWGLAVLFLIGASLPLILRALGV